MTPQDDDPTFTQLSFFPSLGVTKSQIWQDVNSDGMVNIGDLINYTITISNTGDSTIFNYTLNDTFVNSIGQVLTYSGQPGLVSRSGVSPVSDAGTLKSGEQHVYSAQFIINETAFAAPFISNSMTVIGDSNGFTSNVRHL